MKVEPFDTQRQLTFTRRATVAGGITALLFGGVAFRLYDLQVRRYEEFLAKAEDNRFRRRVVVPPRGDILDRYGHLIATNRQNFRVLLVPERTDDIAHTIANVEGIIPLTDRQRAVLLREIADKANEPFTPILVVDNLNWDQFSKVNFNAPRLKGVQGDVGRVRYYPDGEVVAPIVGHVGAADRRDVRNAADNAERLLLRQPGFRIGKIGLENTFETELRGEAGSAFDEIDSVGRVIERRDNDGDDAQQGQTLGLTIDAELQRAAYDVLNADYQEYPEGTPGPGAVSASAVVMDIQTGDVLVLASTPSFDPNQFARVVEPAVLRGLETSPLNPMWCKPIRGAYHPGSTFKMLTAIAAQESGISPSTRFNCPGGMNFGGRFFNCWQQRGHGSVDMLGAIKYSCDTYFYQLATRLDVDQIAAVARRYGLGEIYNLGISGEVAGIVPSRAWKRDYYRTQPEEQVWFPGETLSVAIGQGAATSTPLQLAVMSARLASGKRVMPRLVRGVGDTLIPAPAFPFVEGDQDHLSVIRAGMDAVVNEWGTAARSTLMPDFRMAGKTGTAQVRSLEENPETGRPFQNHELPWGRRDHALFVCFAPVEAPRYACSVVVEHGGSGSRSAGPRARDIMRAVMEKDPSNRGDYPLWSPGSRPLDDTIAAVDVSGAGGRP